ILARPPPEAGAALDQVGEPRALLVVERVMHLREQPNEGLAALFEQRVVAGELLPERDAVERRAPQGLGQLLAAVFRLAAPHPFELVTELAHGGPDRALLRR